MSVSQKIDLDNLSTAGPTIDSIIVKVIRAKVSFNSISDK